MQSKYTSVVRSPVHDQLAAIMAALRIWQDVDGIDGNSSRLDKRVTKGTVCAIKLALDQMPDHRVFSFERGGLAPHPIDLDCTNLKPIAQVPAPPK